MSAEGGETGGRGVDGRPLLDRYPALKKKLAHVPLADLPTRVHRLERLEDALGPEAPAVFIKRDDESSRVYGGNKVRKLEFVLARAKARGYSSVLTFGAVGSNHALATALFARLLGLGCISILVPQPNTMYTRRNLLMQFRSGAMLRHHSGIPAAAAGTIPVLIRSLGRTRSIPYLVPPGGSSPLGSVGFVNAGLELRAQVEAGMLPAPDLIYVAAGTLGTAVGLALGLAVAGLHSRVMAVRVADAAFVTISRARRLYKATSRLLSRSVPGLPDHPFPSKTFHLRHDHFGRAYALYTDEGVRACRLLRDTEGVLIEGTYTGKTLAALVADAEAGALRDKTVLFWNTSSSRNLEQETAGMDYRALPSAFHRYFEEDVQPLDREAWWTELDGAP